MKTATVHTRWMIKGDMPEVIRIEAESFPDPWNAEDFALVLRQRESIGMVAEVGDRVVGYTVYQLTTKSLRILGLAVDPSWRRQDVGTAIINQLKARLGRKKGRLRIVLEIADGNLQGQLFFRSQEFVATKVLRDYFDVPGGAKCDAYRMEYRIKEDK